MDVAMIYRGENPHPAHRGFAKAINADILSLDRYSLDRYGLKHSIPEEILNGAILPEYDVYIAEGTRALYGALTNQSISDSILIYLAGDQALYKLNNNSYINESHLNSIISSFGMSVLKKLFNKYIDGVIAISDFTAEYTSSILPNKPIEIAHPYIQPSLYKRLGNVTPALDEKVAVTIGAYTKYKGQDILAKSWPLVRKKHSSAELKLIGTDYPSQLEDIPGVSVLGYIDDLSIPFSAASLYIQPSRVDGFAVTVVEAMRAGIPPIVTTTTGSKSEAQKISNHLITEASEEELANSINKYFSLSKSDRRDFSHTARELGSCFDSKSRRYIFKHKFYELISKIQ